MFSAKLRPPRAEFLSRDRLRRRLDDALNCGLGLVVAPAGAGKTTVLTEGFRSFDGPKAWIRLDHGDGSALRFVQALDAALGKGDDHEHIDDLITELDYAIEVPTLLVIDDAHAVAESEAGEMIQALVANRPEKLALLIGSRPGGPIERADILARHDAVAFVADDLRFRTWEAEALFRHHYGDRLPPDDVAKLNRMTGGWAAALHLFHLATVGRGSPARRRMLDGLGGRTRLTDDYLAHHVLDSLPLELADFFVSTAVFTTICAPLCNELLGCDDAAGRLRELERRGLVSRLDDDQTFTCHEVIRRHLEARLVESVPPDEVEHMFRCAGHLLVSAGLSVDALRAFARSGDFDAARSLLDEHGEDVISDVKVFDSLPAELRHDPWLLLASSRRAASDGALEIALAGLARVESSGVHRPARLAAIEARDLRGWLEPNPSPIPSSSDRLRQALIARPRAVARQCDEQDEPVDGRVVAAALLASGDCRGSLRRLGAHLVAATDEVTSVELGCLELLAEALQSGVPSVNEIDRLADVAHKCGRPRAARLVRAVESLSFPEGSAGAGRAAAEASRVVGDRWGEAIARLVVLVGSALRGEPEPGGAETRQLLVDLGAPVLVLWAEAALLAGKPADLAAARSLEARAREAGLPGVRLLAFRMLAEHDARVVPAMKGVATDLGLEQWIPTHEGPPARVQCFGPALVTGPSGPMDNDGCRPRARELLRLLVVLNGRSISTERISDLLWPDRPSGSARHNVQVAVSGARKWLAEAGVAEAILREDDSYTINTAVVTSDLADLMAAIIADDAERALLIADDELLPHDQASEWWNVETADLRAAIDRLAVATARNRLAAGDHDGALRSCAVGLRHDRWNDALWRTMVETYRARGDRAAAARAEADYEAMLAELGVD